MNKCQVDFTLVTVSEIPHTAAGAATSFTQSKIVYITQTQAFIMELH